MGGKVDQASASVVPRVCPRKPAARVGLLGAVDAKVGTFPISSCASLPTDDEDVGSESEPIVSDVISSSPTAEIVTAGIKLGCLLDIGAETSLIPSSIYHSRLK